MGAAELIGVAASVSLLSGWRLYLCVFGVGLAMRSGWLDLPDKLAALDALANPWVIAVAGMAALVELFADKVAWLDSAWDAVHTLVRPIGGALLALAVIDPADPAAQVVALLLGGSGALLTHGAKAGARAAVNTSPEPFSNVLVSTGEDIATGGLLWLALAEPELAALVAAVVLIAALALLWWLRRVVTGLLRRREA